MGDKMSTLLVPPFPGAIPVADFSSRNETDTNRIDWPTFARFWLALHPEAAVVIKLTQGDWYLNPFRQRQRLGAHAAGILNVGLYHYTELVASGGANEGKNLTGAQNADFFLQAVGEDGGIQKNEFLAGDWEQTDYISTTADLRAALLDFEGRIQRPLGIQALFYSGDWYAIPHDIEDDPAVAALPKWWAAYGPVTPSHPANIVLWQFTDRGVFPGLPFPVDVSWWLAGLPALRTIQWGYAPDPLGGKLVAGTPDIAVNDKGEAADVTKAAQAIARDVELARRLYGTRGTALDTLLATTQADAAAIALIGGLQG